MPYKMGRAEIDEYSAAVKQLNASQNKPARRLEYLRGEIRAGRISWEEIAELQSLAKHIQSDDVELLEAVGIPE